MKDKSVDEVLDELFQACDSGDKKLFAKLAGYYLDFYNSKLLSVEATEIIKENNWSVEDFKIGLQHSYVTKDSDYFLSYKNNRIKTIFDKEKFKPLLDYFGFQ